MRKIKVAIIGAGTAGLSARREIAKHTDDYLVIDDGVLGTTCARVGCMPSKVLLQIAEDFHRRHVLPTMGILGSEGLKVDDGKVLEHVRSLRDRFVRAVLHDMDSWRTRHLVQKKARFLDQHILALGDEKVEAERIIIATGSAPILPNSWRPYQKYLLDTDSFFESNTLPHTMAVVGLGVIGLEIGQALHRLGVKVLGLGQGKSLGGLSDPQLQAYTWDSLGREFPLHDGAVQKLSEDKGQLLIETEQGRRFKVDRALIAVGRRPRLEGLGLKELGIQHSEQGIPVFDPQTLQIVGTPLFLVGDANGDRPILHEAADEGRIAGFNSLQTTAHCMQRRVPFSITYCSPQIALVGQSYAQLVESGIDFVTGEQSFEGQGRAIVKHVEMGRIHVYAAKVDGRLLGAELFCPDAEHLAHLLAWSISARQSLGDLLNFPIYHPSLEEGLRSALRQAALRIQNKPDAIELLRCENPRVGSS